MPRRPAPFAVAALAIALLAGCGDSSMEGEREPTLKGRHVEVTECETRAADLAMLRVTEARCSEGRRVMRDWQRSRSCAPPAGASRHGCAVGSYRCASIAIRGGVAVSCFRPGQAVAFRARR
ncbi:MAG TPA: hypothetical protein VFY48_03650 [Solirubrobacterales bacterium]|nr:hypothetical protein [Solirubrobacterales bacterium]